MSVLTFDIDQTKLLEVGDQRYFLLQEGPCPGAVVPAACPHRGGPLHLATPDESGTRLICPWHDSKVSITWLLRSALPSVRSERTVAVVVEDASSRGAAER